MRELIRVGTQLDGRDEDGYAPIHHAADTGNLDGLKELVRAGSSHALLSGTGQTPLAVACLTGHPGVVKYLLNTCKADPGKADEVGYTPLAIAAQHGHFAVVKMLLRFGVGKLGPNAYRDALCGVAMCGNLRMIRELVNAEGGVHVKGAKTSLGMTPLHYSAGYCHPLATALLLEAGGDEKAADSIGETPLDVVDTKRSEHVPHGVGRRRVRRMLMQGPAYRARSWRWPCAEVMARGCPTATAGGVAGSAEDTAKSRGDAAKVREDPAESNGDTAVEWSAKDFDDAFEAATATVLASAMSRMVATAAFRSRSDCDDASAASADDCRSSVLGSLMRWVVSLFAGVLHTKVWRLRVVPYGFV